MRVTTTGFNDLLLIEPDVFADARGWFAQIYHRKDYDEAGIVANFVQENRSLSRAGVLRGLHFQEPCAQGKLVEVNHGSIFDVAVDIRKGSPNFGRWFGIKLNADNHLQLWIPPGFAHGFIALENETDVIYRCTSYYAPQHEHTLLWNDPDLAIRWPMLECSPCLSAKDLAGVRLKDLQILPCYTSR